MSASPSLSGTGMVDLAKRGRGVGLVVLLWPRFLFCLNIDVEDLNFLKINFVLRL